MLYSKKVTESIDNYRILADYVLFYSIFFEASRIYNLIRVLLSNDLLLVDKEPIIVELFHDFLCVCFRFY